VIRVGIFMAGPSLEKEVSFNSGRTICDHLDRQFYIPIPLFISSKRKLFILPWQFLYRGKISDFENRLESEATEIYWDDLNNIIDFAYLALHGFLGEDGNIQGMLTVLNIPFSGSSILTNALCINKQFILHLLSLHKIDTPAEIHIDKNTQEINHAIEFLKKHQKIVIKPGLEGSSLGISIIEKEADLPDAIYKAKTINPEFDQNVIAQEYISGREFSIIALEKDKNWLIFEPTEIVTNNTLFSYNQKYLPGSICKFTPGRFSEDLVAKIKETIKKIITIIEPNDIIRIDGIIAQEKIIHIIDINTFPGTAPSSFVFLQSALSGLNPANVINIIIENALKRYKKEYHIQSKNNYRSCAKKINIAVLLGGNSNEKEISLESGRNVYYKLSTMHYNPFVVFVSSSEQYYLLRLEQLVKDTTVEIEESITPEQEIPFNEFKTKFDFIFICLHGGNGENGVLQKKLENINIPFNGSGSKTSHICMHKSLTLEILDQYNIITTDRLLIKKDNRNILQEINFIESILLKYKKIIIKPNDDGCSAFVCIAQTLAETTEAINSIFQTNKTTCLIEGCIAGIELTVGIIGNQDNYLILPITQTVKSENILSIEEKFLPGAGENITPALFNDETTITIQYEIRKAYQALNCNGYSRIDCFWHPLESKLIILECNTLPALTPATCLFHQAAELDINPSDFINYLVYLGYKKQNLDHTLDPVFLVNIDKTTTIINENIKKQKPI
jgi:D-alanine--D-alanine ligase